MQLVCTVSQKGAESWLARHTSREAGEVEARGRTRREALEKLEGEIRYRLELCPCTGETYRHIHLEVVEAR